MNLKIIVKSVVIILIYRLDSLFGTGQTLSQRNLLFLMPIE